ncbi:uncharacterized protein LOC130675504 [Microplitis mediator]|uniref:uncharacterized protein LOC130675504 n=1 Tax=Microplitis mediator TaxID=375433 RepID=UPI00255316AD|nr:uncharacterized protein LOC130675504 [Microplitis mediator]
MDLNSYSQHRDMKVDNDTMDCLLNEFAEKNVKLELMKELASKSESNLRRREEDFKNMEKKLDSLHNSIFKMENDLCESIWKFVAEHDFASVINKFLDEPTINYQENNNKSLRKISKIKSDVQTIISDITDIKIDIDKSLIEIHEKLTRQIDTVPKKLNDSTDFIREIKIEDKKDFIKIEKEPDSKTQMKFETPRPSMKSSRFSVKKKTPICKKFEMSS